jgi:hypothetical protein
VNSDVVETVLTNNGTNLFNDTATSLTVNNVTLAKEYHSVKNLSTIIPPQGAAKQQQTDVELIPSAESNKVLKELTNSRENEALTKNETRSSSTTAANDLDESMSAQTVSVSSFSERKGQLKNNTTSVNATLNATVNATTEATSPEPEQPVTQKSLPTTTARTRRPTTGGYNRRRKSTTTTSTTTTSTTTEAPEVETTIKTDDSVGSETTFGE